MSTRSHAMKYRLVSQGWRPESPATWQPDYYEVPEIFNTFFKRLNVFRRTGETDRAFCERIGVKLATFRNWKRGGEPKEPRIAYEIARHFGVCENWLATGWGSVPIKASLGFPAAVTIPRGHYFLEIFEGEDPYRQVAIQ